MADDKVAVVTASGQGIGAGVARGLHAKGYRLALMSPSGRSIALANELGCVGLNGSVTEPADLEALVGTALDEYGHIDAVCANTGLEEWGVGSDSRGIAFNPDLESNLLDVTDEGWIGGLDLLFMYAVRLARLVTPHMLERGKGAIVNISSEAAHAPMLEYPLTSTIRTGLSAFTKLYSDKYSRHNIRMNTVMVGYASNLGFPPEVSRCIPMQRPGSMEEAAGIVALLFSDDAAYITGENLMWDGGLARGL